MFDINTAINTAIAAAVAEATKPLIERIATLEAQLAQATPAPQVGEAVSAYLDNAESFWHRIECFVQTRTADAVDKAVADAIDAHLEDAGHLDEDDIDTKIEEAIERHEENNTHGDNDDIEEIVQRLLNSASISITV
jgi:AcrR family transcriptional regulator